MTIRFTPIPTALARAYQAGAPDAHGQPPEQHVSDGGGNPCRHCLKMIAQGSGMLVLAYRPFPAPQPYAETGPIFLCADPRAAPEPGEALPEVLVAPDYVLRGYSTADRIVYGTGGVVATAGIAARAASLLAREDVAYVHVRSARNTCYQLRIDRA